MPLEISEIGVHIAVGGASPETPPQAPPSGVPQPVPGQSSTPSRVQRLVTACVRKVMTALRQRETG